MPLIVRPSRLGDLLHHARAGIAAAEQLRGCRDGEDALDEGRDLLRGDLDVGRAIVGVKEFCPDQRRGGGQGCNCATSHVSRPNASSFQR